MLVGVLNCYCVRQCQAQTNAVQRLREEARKDLLWFLLLSSSRKDRFIGQSCPLALMKHATLIECLKVVGPIGKLRQVSFQQAESGPTQDWCGKMYSPAMKVGSKVAERGSYLGLSGSGCATTGPAAICTTTHAREIEPPMVISPFFPY